MNQGYLLGIDAGATKTAYAIYDIQKDRTYLLTGGCGNHECMAGSYDELYEVMKTHIEQLCAQAGISISDITAAGLGVAGTDTRYQHRHISEVFDRIGLKRFRLANDAMLGIKAESEDGSGICAINGTGFCVYGVDQEGQFSQIGGIGDMTGDQGGGSYYAWKTVEAAYRFLEKEGPETLMTQEILALLKAQNASQMLESISQKQESGESKALVYEFSVLLHQAASKGDAVAQSILRASGMEYAACILSVLRHLPRLTERKKLTLILVGSCFLRGHCPLVKETILQRLHERLPELSIEVKMIQTEPVAGALLWAAEQVCPQGELRRTILASFSHAIQCTAL